MHAEPARDRVTPLFHITSMREAEAARELGAYRPEAFRREGFVHCSYRSQVVSVANRLFRGKTDLVLLEIEPARLACKVVDENLTGGAELFPHVYSPIPMSAVVAIHPFPCDQNGAFTSLPDV
jgi:uncharacterized protein (DUF952 family)